MLSSKEKKDLVDEIRLLSKHEHLEIFKIIKNGTNKYTENNNGIFVNLSLLDNEIIENIRNFVMFCKQNKKNLELEEESINTEKNKIFRKQNYELNKPSEISEKQESNEESESDKEEMIGAKIQLKKTKPKFSGIKAKLIKGYKQKNSNIVAVTVKNQKSISDNQK